MWLSLLKASYLLNSSFRCPDRSAKEIKLTCLNALLNKGSTTKAHAVCLSEQKELAKLLESELEKKKDEFTEAGPPTAVCLLQRATIV